MANVTNEFNYHQQLLYYYYNGQIKFDDKQQFMQLIFQHVNSVSGSVSVLKQFMQGDLISSMSMGDQVIHIQQSGYENDIFYITVQQSNNQLTYSALIKIIDDLVHLQFKVLTSFQKEFGLRMLRIVLKQSVNMILGSQQLNHKIKMRQDIQQNKINQQFLRIQYIQLCYQIKFQLQMQYNIDTQIIIFDQEQVNLLGYVGCDQEILSQIQNLLFVRQNIEINNNSVELDTEYAHIQLLEPIFKDDYADRKGQIKEPQDVVQKVQRSQYCLQLSGQVKIWLQAFVRLCQNITNVNDYQLVQNTFYVYYQSNLYMVYEIGYLDKLFILLVKEQNSQNLEITQQQLENIITNQNNFYKELHNCFLLSCYDIQTQNESAETNENIIINKNMGQINVNDYNQQLVFTEIHDTIQTNSLIYQQKYNIKQINCLK